MNDAFSWTPAHHAVEHEDAEALAHLLVDGVDPDEVFGGATLLTHALDVEGDGALQTGKRLTVHTTAILLAFGADPQLRDPYGDSPLDVAQQYDHQPAIKLLAEHIERRTGDSR
ncbi:ankyrin repeat domain-containing protein [Streptomyces sp. NPDC050439]|uniref:ankyrin repeat domain-containing protein n=1 Tax=unclassified Streptomyces TaxID=2593676 RepID=UPI00342C0243